MDPPLSFHEFSTFLYHLTGNFEINCIDRYNISHIAKRIDLFLQLALMYPGPCPDAPGFQATPLGWAHPLRWASLQVPRGSHEADHLLLYIVHMCATIVMQCHVMAWYGMVRSGVVWYGKVWYGMLWCGMWYV